MSKPPYLSTSGPRVEEVDDMSENIKVIHGFCGHEENHTGLSPYDVSRVVGDDPAHPTTADSCHICSKQMDQSAVDVFLRTKSAPYHQRLSGARMAAVQSANSNLTKADMPDRLHEAEAAVFKLHSTILYEVRSSETKNIPKESLGEYLRKFSLKVAYEASKKSLDIGGITELPKNPLRAARMKTIEDHTAAAFIARKAALLSVKNKPEDLFSEIDESLKSLKLDILPQTLELAAGYAVYAIYKQVNFCDGYADEAAGLLEGVAQLAQKAGFQVVSHPLTEAMGAEPSWEQPMDTEPTVATPIQVEHLRTQHMQTGSPPAEYMQIGSPPTEHMELGSPPTEHMQTAPPPTEQPPAELMQTDSPPTDPTQSEPMQAYPAQEALGQAEFIQLESTHSSSTPSMSTQSSATHSEVMQQD